MGRATKNRSTVGVTGSSTGGGISYYRSIHGWIADNIVGFEVVTASGEILLVTANQYPDLYWALKGGSGNFAYFVHFYLKTWPSVPIYGGNVLTDASSVDALVDACASFADQKEGGMLDPLAAVNPTIQYTLDSRQFSGFTNVFYNASVSEAPASVKNFTTIPALGNSSVTGPRTFVSFVNETAIFGNDFR